MTIDRLARALGRSARIDEWVIRETREMENARVLGARSNTAWRRSRHYEVTVWRDRRGERGEATIWLSDEDKGDFESYLRAGADRAFSNVGELWKLPPPAAPARVALADVSLRDAPLEAIDSIEKAVGKLAGSQALGSDKSVEYRGKVLVSSIKERLQTSSGLDANSEQTTIGVDLQLGDANSRALFSRTARRLKDLSIDEALGAATDRISQRMAAARVEANSFDLVIAARAFQQSRSVDNWLKPLAVQADGIGVRRGISRYRPGQLVVVRSPEGVESTGDSLSINSDGAIDYGLESARFGIFGCGIRRFKLVEDGVASAIALNAKEAAIANLEANGGARNLHFGRGQRSIDQLVTGNRPVLTVHEFDWLRVDSDSGEIIAQIGLATNGTSRDGVTGSMLSFNLFDALTRLRLSREVSSEVLVPGPAWLGLHDVVIT